MIIEAAEALRMAICVRTQWRDKTVALACIDALEELCDATHRDAVRQVCKWRATARRVWEYHEAKRVLRDEPLVTGPIIDYVRSALDLAPDEELQILLHMRRENLYVVEHGYITPGEPDTPVTVTLSPRYVITLREQCMKKWLKAMQGYISSTEAPLTTAELMLDRLPTS